MLKSSLKTGSSIVIAMILVACGSNSTGRSTKGGSKIGQGEVSKQTEVKLPSKTTQQQTPVQKGAPAKGTATTSTAITTPSTATSTGFNYQPITHLNICLYTDLNGEKNTSYVQCVDVSADGNSHMSLQNLGRDADDDLKSIAVSVQAYSLPGAKPITALNLCLNAESLDTQCTGLKTLNDTEHEAPKALGDNRGDILSAAIGGTAFYSPSALPMTRIQLCVAGEGRYECTGYATAGENGAGERAYSAFSGGDNRGNLRNIGLKFSTLSY